MASGTLASLRGAGAAVFIIFFLASVAAHFLGAPTWVILTLVLGALVVTPFALFGEE